jgi:hypothetical protein
MLSGVEDETAVDMGLNDRTRDEYDRRRHGSKD